MALIQELTARNDYGYIHVQKKGFSLTLHKKGAQDSRNRSAA
jgi:hypothetical protein